MKKIKLATIITAIGLIFVGCGNTQNTIKNTEQVNTATNSSSSSAINNSSSDVTNNSVGTMETTGDISVEEAKKIALQHAGLTEDNVSFVRAELDYDDAIKKYEIEFFYNNKEYDYEINASNGVIISCDYDIEDYSNKGLGNITSQGSVVNSNTQSSTESTVSNNSVGNSTTQGLGQESSVTNSNTYSVISKEEAKEIALNHSGLSLNNISFTKVELDYDDGVEKYEIEFYSNNKEYNYEINAQTGSIISFDRDY